MAYVGKVNITGDWEKLEDLIQAQVSGQSSFAFDTSKKYSLQADNKNSPVMLGVYVCNSATKPDNADDGEYLTEGLFGEYEPESGVDLWIRTRGNSTGVKVAVSQI